MLPRDLVGQGTNKKGRKGKEGNLQGIGHVRVLEQ